MTAAGPDPSPEGDRAAARPRWSPTPRIIAVAVFIFGLAATGCAWWLSRSAAEKALTNEFDRIAAEGALRLEGRLHGFEEALHASAGFVMGSDEVTPGEWERFENTLRISRLLPGATGMDYRVRPLADSAASAAVAEACRSGEISAYLKPQSEGSEPQVVLVRAVYRARRNVSASPACRDGQAGLVLLQFSPAALTRSLNVEETSMAEFSLRRAGPRSGPASIIQGPEQVRVVPVRFAGQSWDFEAHSLPLFGAQHTRSAPFIICLAGIIITTLASALSGSEAQRRRLSREAVSSMRRRLEHTTSALGQTEGRLAGLIDSVMDAIVSVDQNARILLMNPAAERMLRCRSDLVLGQSVLRFFPRSMRETFFREVTAFGRGATQRTVGVQEEVMACRYDGEEFPVEAAISLAEAGGQLSYTIIARDVSERQRTELERRDLEAQLRQSQKMEAIGTLAGGIAHDFNNILGSILGNAELANQDLDEAHGARESLSEIIRAGERARDLVRRILGFTRQQEQQRAPMRLGGVAEEAAAMLRAGLPSRIELVLNHDPEIPPVLADAGQVHQVLMNLIANSAHAIGERPGVIRVTLRRLPAGRDTTLPVHLASRDCLELLVADDGAGMAPAVLDRIFDPFFTTKPVGQGTGLGLSVVHGIVQQHDGVIRVASRPGAGTTVMVYLPGLNEEPEVTPEPASSMPVGHGERVLLVDDEEALRLVNARILRRLGYTPVVAEGPAHALRLMAEGEQVDLVLTDLGMPGMSGTELAGRLLRIKPELPIILLTGFGLTFSPDEFRAMGIRAVLSKPVAIRALADTLAAANPVHV